MLDKKYLLKEYPFIKPSYNVNSDYTQLDDLPIGWYKTFGELICQDIKKHLIKVNKFNDYSVTQIKEKFGMLRWYDNIYDEELNNIISKNEIVSSHICIKCGNPYARMYTLYSWLSPYCNECIKEIINKDQYLDKSVCDDMSKECDTVNKYIYSSNGKQYEKIIDATDLLKYIRQKWEEGNKMSKLNENCPYLEAKCEDIGCDCPKYLAYLDAKDPQKVQSLMDKYGFDTSKSAWELMMQMQTSFEVRFHPMDGLTKEEKEHWLDRYLVCIEDEIREVREHLALYKPFESVDNDIELRKEVIDIWHFVMDLFLALPATPESIKKAYEEYYHVTVDKDLIDFAYNSQKDDIENYLYSKNDQNRDITVLKAACKLSDAGALVRQQISWKHWKKPNKELNYERIYEGFAVVFHEIINLSILTMPIEEIKNIYMAKNIENIFRQEHGY